MWKTVENSSSVKPAEIDRESSQAVVYVRKDFQEVPNVDPEGGQAEGTHWRYLEQTIPKEDWSTYEKAMEADGKADDNAADILYIAMMADIDLDI